MNEVQRHQRSISGPIDQSDLRVISVISRFRSRSLPLSHECRSNYSKFVMQRSHFFCDKATMMWTFRYLALAVGVIFQLNSVVGYASWMQVSDLCVCRSLGWSRAPRNNVWHHCSFHTPDCYSFTVLFHSFSVMSTWMIVK
jgi:hypothetical protein